MTTRPDEPLSAYVRRTLPDDRGLIADGVAKLERELDIAKGIGRVDRLALDSASETIVLLKTQVKQLKAEIVYLTTGEEAP